MALPPAAKSGKNERRVKSAGIPKEGLPKPDGLWYDIFVSLCEIGI